MATKTISMDKKWLAECDARTLAEYQQIMSDSKRRSAAVKEAQKQAQDLTRRANILKSIGKNKK